MKKRVITLLFMCLSLGVIAEDGVRIFLSDSTSIYFNNNDIDSITYSKIDLDGTLCKEAVVKEFWSEGSCTRLQLAMIDSVWFVTPTLSVDNDLAFGEVPAGSKMTKQLTITNNGMTDEQFFVRSRSPLVSVDQPDGIYVLESGKSVEVTLTFAPEFASTLHSEVCIFSNAIEKGCKEVAVSGRGTRTGDEYIFPNVVVEEVDKVKTVLCDTLNNQYIVQYEDEVPDIKPGSVTFVKTDSMTLVLLVTEASKEGNIVDMKGHIGDLSYVFHDVAFSVNTQTNEIVVEQLGGQKAKSKYRVSRDNEKNEDEEDDEDDNKPFSSNLTIFEGRQEFDFDVVDTNKPFTSDKAKITISGYIHPTVECELYFKFYDTVYDFFEAVEFVKARLFETKFKLIGDVKAKAGLTATVSQKNERYETEPDVKEPILKKKNLFPPAKVDFVIGVVPVDITFGCDLYEQAELYFEGEFNCNFGVHFGWHGEWGFDYWGTSYKEGTYTRYKEITHDWQFDNPTVDGQVTAGMKCWLIPRFYARVYNIVGPCVEIKPYFDFHLGGAFQREWDVGFFHEDNYLTTYAHSSLGIDWGVGLSICDGLKHTFDWDDKTWDQGKTFLPELVLMKSPSNLELVNQSTKKIRAFKPVSLCFDAKANYLWWKDVSSVLCPIINIDIPRRNSYYTPIFTKLGSGEGWYLWEPLTDDEVLYAKVYDEDGKVVKEIEIPDPNDDTMWTGTNPATDVTSSTAVLNGYFDPGQTVVIDEMGFDLAVDDPSSGSRPQGTLYRIKPDDIIGNHSYNLSGLKPGTTYRYRTFAKNRYRIMYGTDTEFTTEACIPVTDILFREKTISLLVGENQNITWKVIPLNASDKSLSWASSNPNVATVDDGLVHAVGAGNCLVFAVSHDGSAIKESCTVNVTQSIQTTLEAEVSNLSFDAESCSRYLALQGNDHWLAKVTNGSDWLTLSTSRGTGNSSITVTAAANSTFSSRKGTITVTPGEAAPFTVTATQNGRQMKITPNKASFTFQFAGGQQLLELSGNGKWSLSIAEGSGWLSASTRGGTGNASITLTAKENSTAATRSGKIVITPEDSPTITINITQEAAPCTLSVNRTSYSLHTDGGSRSIELSGNDQWTMVVTKGSSWISLSAHYGTGSRIVTFTVKENTSSSKRTGTIVVSPDHGDPIFVTVNQDGTSPTLIADKTSFSFDAVASEQTLRLSGDDDWTTSVTKGSDWLSVSPNRGTGNAAITISVSENESIENRTGTIVVTPRNAPAITVTVTQKEAVLLTADKTALSFTAIGGTQTFQLIGNDSWKVNVIDPADWMGSNRRRAKASSGKAKDNHPIPDWVKITPNRGSGNGIITVTVSANSDLESRDAVIAITPTEAPAFAVTVKQKGQ